jgi:hypothetical protein
MLWGMLALFVSDRIFLTLLTFIQSNNIFITSFWCWLWIWSHIFDSDQYKQYRRQLWAGISRNDHHLLTFVAWPNFCYQNFKNYFGTAWFSVVRGKILENWHNSQLSFLAVYRQYESLKAIVEITELANFVEKTFLHLLRRLRTRTDERTQRKVQNSRDTLKNRFFWPSVKSSVTCMFWYFPRVSQKEPIFWI